MTNLFYFNLATSLFLGMTVAASFFSRPSSSVTMQRIQEITKGVAQSTADRARKDRLGRLIARIALLIRTHLWLSEEGGLGGRITQAGYRGALPVDLYIATRIVGPLAALALAIFIPYARLFWIIALPSAAYLIPDVLLEYLIRRRRAAIRRSIADTIDLLVICVDAGLGIDQAIMRVAQELALSYPEMHDELGQMNREQRAGKPRLGAWQAMAERIALPEIDSFVNMLIQTERFGTPIARALSNFAGGIRLKRTQKAEESAAKTTIKIIFPLVLFIFPSIFIVLLGPAALTVMRGFSSNF
jgi:tight adherence protein C